MRKASIILTALLLWSIYAFAQPDTLWTRTIGENIENWGNSGQQTEDGGYIVVGATGWFYGANRYDVYLIKTDANGYEQWSRSFGGIDYDYGDCVQQTADGGYIITGRTDSFGAVCTDVCLIKTDAQGSLEWYRTFGGDSDDEGNSVQQTSDGGYIIVGGTCSFGAGPSDVYLIKTDALGNELWSRTLGGNDSDWGNCGQQTSDGGYIITGMTYSSSTGENVCLIKTDSLGNEVWTHTYGAGVSFSNWGYCVQQTSDGGYIIAGKTLRDFTGYDVYLIKTDPSGNEEWNQTFDEGSIDWGLSVQQTSDGGYIIAGKTHVSPISSYDAYLIKTDATGNEEWHQTLGGSESDYAFSIQQTSDEGYIIVGCTESYGTNDLDVWLIRLEPEYAPLTSITLTPHNPPIQIPAAGGSFLYDLAIENTDTVGGYFDAWVNALLPDSSLYGPILLRQNIFLPASGTILRDSMAQFVPSTAPPGFYSYIANVGSYPDNVMDSDSFTFEKLPGRSDPGNHFGWTLFGWESEDAPTITRPWEFSLLPACPNPFNPTTAIRYQLSALSFVNLSVYDVRGRKVAELVNGWREAGSHEVAFDGSNLASGIYIYRLEAGHFRASGKMVLVK